LRAGALGGLSLFWDDWQRLDASTPASRKAKAKSVILIFNCGAPSHLDLWDMKPHAPENMRGPFRPIATNVPGIQVSELMPGLARHADKLAVVRTVHHGHSQHNSGMYWSIVGRPYRVDSTLINPTRVDTPSFGTLVGWLAYRDGYSSPLPPYVITPAPHCDSNVYITPGQFGSCLGAKFDPLVVNSDGRNPTGRATSMDMAEGLNPGRVGERRSLLTRLDHATFVDPQAQVDFEVNQAKAFSLVMAPEVQKAFDLSREPVTVRDRYGRHSWGQSHLLARRLVEAGVRFVTTVNGPSIIWDTHKDNFNLLKNRLVPPMERAYAACSTTWRAAACSTVRWWSGWAISVARRRSTATRAAITGSIATRWCWPEAAYEADKSTASPMRSAPIPVRFLSHPPTSTPPCSRHWASIRTPSSTNPPKVGRRRCRKARRFPCCEAHRSSVSQLTIFFVTESVASRCTK
jgi:hypothetical protein